MCSPECSSTLAQLYVLQITIASDASFAGIIAVNVEDRTPAVPNATDLIILCYMEPSAERRAPIILLVRAPRTNIRPVLLALVNVIIEANGFSCTSFAVLDPGSEATLITLIS